MIDIFRANSPEGRDIGKARDTTAHDLLEIASRRAGVKFAHEPLLHADVLEIVGRLYYRLGEYDKAEELARARIAILEQSGGPNTLDTRNAYRNLGYTLQAAGDRAGATRVQERIAELVESGTGVAGSERAAAHISSARAALPLDPKLALQQAQAALQILDTQDHISRFVGYRLLAMTAQVEALSLLEDYAAALLVARSVLELNEHSELPDGLYSTLARARLGYVEREALYLAAATNHLEQAWRDSQKRVGRNNPNSLVMQAQLGALRWQGGQSGGLEMLASAVQALGGNKNANSRDTLAATLDLAQARFLQGRPADAQALLDPLIIQLAERAEHRPLLARAYLLQGRLANLRGRHDDALGAANKALALSLQSGLVQLPSSIQAQALAAEAHLAVDHMLDASNTLARSAEQPEAPGLRMPINKITRDLANAQLMLLRGESSAAVTLYSDSVKRIDLDDERQYYSEALARSLEGMGCAQLMVGEIQAARQSLQRAVDLRSRREAADSPWLAHARVSLADALISLGQSSAARRLLAQAAAAYERQGVLGRQFLYPLEKVSRRLN
jgi:tetratricopeptide (TPR) repeat protein